MTWLWASVAFTALAVGWLVLWFTATGMGLSTGAVLTRVVPELIYWNVWAALTPAVFWLSRRFSFPLQPLSWKWSVHLVLAPLVAFVMHGLMLAGVSAYFVLVAELGGTLTETLDQTVQRRVFGMFTFGVPMGCIVYALLLALAQGRAYVQQLRIEERRSAVLQAQLAQAELQALKMQLHPHFLFNALNTISSTLHTDSGAADRMLAQLGDFLRLTLEHAHRATVPLTDELNFIEHYLQIEQHRLEDRLTVRVDVEQGAYEAAVPYLILQPLVENALRHGIGQRVEEGRVEIRAYREEDSLVLDVENTGPPLTAGGMGDREPSGGIGLVNTRARLEQGYGAAASLQIEDIEGGVRASVRIPFIHYDADRQEPVPSRVLSSPVTLETDAFYD